MHPSVDGSLAPTSARQLCVPLPFLAPETDVLLAADVQEVVFEQHVRIAVELGKPLFCHEREAHSKFLEVTPPPPPGTPKPTK